MEDDLEKNAILTDSTAQHRQPDRHNNQKYMGTITKFKKYTTEMNEGAKVVRTEAGGYLSMSSSMTQRRLCHMHQLDFIKKVWATFVPMVPIPPVTQRGGDDR